MKGNDTSRVLTLFVRADAKSLRRLRALDCKSYAGVHAWLKLLSLMMINYSSSPARHVDAGGHTSLVKPKLLT